MNRNLLALLGLAPILSPLNGAANDRPDPRPNIIFFLVDDMGWQDTSLPFWTQKTMYNERYETPNMERLARQGMMFTQAYASSISSPTRCSLMTGANAARHRVTNWTLQKDKTTDAQSDVLQLPDWNYNGIAQVEGTNHTFVAKSFVQFLKDSGYCLSCSERMDTTPSIAERRTGGPSIPRERIPATSASRRTSPDMRRADWPRT